MNSNEDRYQETGHPIIESGEPNLMTQEEYQIYLKNKLIWATSANDKVFNLEQKERSNTMTSKTDKEHNSTLQSLNVDPYHEIRLLKKLCDEESRSTYHDKQPDNIGGSPVQS